MKRDVSFARYYPAEGVFEKVVITSKYNATNEEMEDETTVFLKTRLSCDTLRPGIIKGDPTTGEKFVILIPIYMLEELGLESDDVK